MHIDILVDLLLDGDDGLVGQLLVLEQEGEFLESAVVGLGVHEVDEGELEEDPAAVDGHEFPAYGVQGYGVDVVVEESSDLAEDLFDSDTTCALRVGPEFDEVGCCWLVDLKR
jgi:hypothetical protein